MGKPPIERWRDRPPGGAGLEDLAGERFREVRTPEVDEVRLARVARRITEAVETPPSWSRVRRLQWAAAAILLGTTFTAGAAMVGVRVVQRIRMAEARRAVAVAPSAARPATPPAPVEPALPEPQEVPPAEVETPREVTPSPVHPHRVATTTGGLSGEARLLHTALEDLNVRGNPTSALVSLDAYRTRYPSGVLSREADVARVDALLRLGRDAEALVLLDRGAESGFQGYARPAQLRVLRGELLAKAGRCEAAVSIFSDELSDAEVGQAAERALYGRATCRAALGQIESSRADLTRYLELYPQGHYARAARQALER